MSDDELKDLLHELLSDETVREPAYQEAWPPAWQFAKMRVMLSTNINGTQGAHRSSGNGRSGPDPMVNPSAGSACPYVGRHDDGSSYYDFPTDDNCCHAGKRPVPIASSHQSTVCLTQDWAACPRYQTATGQASLMAGTAPPAGRHLPRLSRPVWILATILALADVLLERCFWSLVEGQLATNRLPPPFLRLGSES
jgi:hypothetical protein